MVKLKKFDLEFLTLLFSIEYQLIVKPVKKEDFIMKTNISKR